MEDEGYKDIREYLAVVRRHKVQILCVAVVLSAAAAAVAINLPPVYRSSAVILVQEQEVPPDLVRSTVTSFADERIQVIGQRVLTRGVLLPLVEKYNLYENYRRHATDDAVLDRMRQEIKISPVDANMSDRGSGRRVNATIAFRISYDSPNSDRAQDVVNELVTLYLNENVKARQESVAETTTFLAKEADRLAGQIQEIEANLADFKRRNADRMPDLSAVNRQRAERTQAELVSIGLDMSILQDRKASLEAQLSVVKPNAPVAYGSDDPKLTPEERLRALQAEYNRASALYRAAHPDMRRMRREMAALKPSVEASRVPDNPAYIALATQLDNTNSELARLSAQRDELRAMQRSYDALLLEMPEVEREYNDLTRDYDNARSRYRDVKAKQMEAEIAQSLEKDRKAERFSVGEPASLPRKPVGPNRMQIALIGLVGALGSGLGLAWLRDAINPSVKGPLELARLARVPILTPIPYIETRRERARVRRRTWLVVLFTVVLTTMLVLGIRFFLESRY
jgi:polysaccharide chain length determinant protein (PEP-CTERM system associated)